MALTIPQILRQFKTDVAKALAPETILKIRDNLGYVCRERVLGPVATVQVFLLQILTARPPARRCRAWQVWPSRPGPIVWPANVCRCSCLRTAPARLRRLVSGDPNQ